MITIQTDIFSDIICPWCYIGKKRLDRALSERPDVALAVRWRAFQLNPDMPAQGMDRTTYYSLKFGGAARAEKVAATLRQAARLEGIEMALSHSQRVPSTVDAHRLVRYAARQDKATVLTDILFRRYFVEEQDIGRADVLIDSAAEAALSGDIATYLAGTAERQAVISEDAWARNSGVTGVPCFIFARRYALVGAEESASFKAVIDAARMIDDPMVPDTDWPVP